ncbi:MAG: hypothetical protein ACRDKS_09085 [Actinomycetota bacterium]
MRRHRAVLLLVPFLAMALAACAGQEKVNLGAPPAPPAPPANDLPATGVPGGADPGGGLGTGSPQMVSVRQGLQNVHPINWVKADVSDNDRKLRVQFYDGIEDCYGLAGVDVRYTKDSIVVTLTGGTVPGANICIEIAVLKGTIVELKEKVNGRTIVDGAPQ